MLADLRFALRSLRRTPGFTVLASLILAIGIGSTTTMFSLVDALVLRPIALPEPERLVSVYETNLPRNQLFFSVAAPNYLDWRDRAQSWASLAAMGWQAMNLENDGAPELLRVRPMTANLVPTLGLALARGRNFLPAEDVPGGKHVAIISAGFSRRYFGTLDAVSRDLRFNGVPYTVVGVLAPDQHLPDGFQVGVPLALPPGGGDRTNHELEVYGRLKPGVTLAAAGAELKTLASTIAQQLPATEQGWGTRLVPFARDVVSDNIRTQVFVLFGAVAVLLLIASANLSCLLSVRASARAHELAVRSALGATRVRVVRPIVLESLLVAALGGGAGVLLSLWGVDLMRAQELPRAAEIALDFRVLSMACGLTCLVGVSSGLIPAWRASLADARQALQSRGPQAGHRSRSRDVLVVAQIALSLVLLANTALLARSFWQLLKVDPGFRPQNVLTVALHPARDETAFYERLLVRVTDLPGVEAAGVVSGLPLTEGNTSLNVFPRGPSPIAAGESLQADWRLVGGDYFRALGIPLLGGRTFATLSPAEAAKSIVISASLARALFGTADPIGREIDPGGHGRFQKVVGVVGDVRRNALGEAPLPTFYWSMYRFIYGPMHLAIRTTGEPASVLGPLKAAVQEIDPAVPLFHVRTLEDVREDSLARERLALLLLGAFAGASLLLAALGTYGVVAFAVHLRTREIGIRISIGAQRGDVVRLVMATTLRLATIGMLAGLGCAFATARLLASLLYATPVTDLASYLLAVGVLLATALLAACLPARRATRVDPMIALRTE